MNKALESIKNCELCDNKPCLVGCPLDNDIPAFIKALANNNVQEAYKILTETTVLMSICGRICPHFKQCEGSCIKRHTNNKVRIGKLEAFVGDQALKNGWQYEVLGETKYRVAVIGGGPAGLTCAAFLRKYGVNVTVYEKYDYLGGLLIHGIPDFRLPKDLVNQVIDNILKMGIIVKYKQELGKNLNLNTLKQEYDAIFIAIGANISNKMHIKGENLKGVFGGNELLEKKKTIDFKDKDVIVSGGGDVSMDVARTIIRLRAKSVKIIFRRKENNMSADIKGIRAAKRDNVEIICNTTITRINGDKVVQSVSVEQLVDDKIIKQNISCDYVIMAIGSHPQRLVKKLDLELNDKGRILIDKNSMTSDSKIFAGGDIAGIKSTVAWAARSGRNAAYSILDYLKINID